jgi:hypothetical protein
VGLGEQSAPEQLRADCRILLLECYDDTQPATFHLIPATSANADPAAVTCTTEPVNRPDRTPSIEAMPLGDVGDPLPHAENNVASVAPEATWQAPAKNRRRETGVFVSDIAILVRVGHCRVGNIKATRKRPGFS